MNRLSWFLYLAELAGSLKEFFIGAGIAMGFAAGVYIFAKAMIMEERPQHIFKMAIALAVVFFLSAITPSRQTLYLIAASEAGESVVASEDGKEILDLIKGRIKKELKPKKDAE